MKHKVQLLNYEDLPAWYKDSYSAIRGFRPISNSYIISIQSLLYLHNETVNIYSHLGPATILLLAQLTLGHVLSFLLPAATSTDHLVFRGNILATSSTLLLSSAYHLMRNHSPEVFRGVLALDYMGIPLLIFGDYVSQVYVDFYCRPQARGFYWTTAFGLAPLASTIFLHPRMKGLKHRKHRICAVAVIASLRLAPLMHAIISLPEEKAYLQTGIRYWLSEVLLYIIGGLIFLTRVPESLSPGTFDIFLASHSIYHICVVLASFLHLYGVWKTLSGHLENPTQCLTVAIAN